MTEVDRSIEGVAKAVTGVLSNQKYSIDYYQREYKWESKQARGACRRPDDEIRSDIYEPTTRARTLRSTPCYYLGSIIISQKGGEPFIVDGQQRLTSLTLLLTFLRRLQDGRTDTV